MRAPFGADEGSAAGCDSPSGSRARADPPPGLEAQNSEPSGNIGEPEAPEPSALPQNKWSRSPAEETKRAAEVPAAYERETTQELYDQMMDGRIGQARDPATAACPPVPVYREGTSTVIGYTSGEAPPPEVTGEGRLDDQPSPKRSRSSSDSGSTSGRATAETLDVNSLDPVPAEQPMAVRQKSANRWRSARRAASASSVEAEQVSAAAGAASSTAARPPVPAIPRAAPPPYPSVPPGSWLPSGSWHAGPAAPYPVPNAAYQSSAGTRSLSQRSVDSDGLNPWIGFDPAIREAHERQSRSVPVHQLI